MAKSRRINVLLQEFDRVAAALKSEVIGVTRKEAERIRETVSQGVDEHMGAAAAQQEKQAKSLRAILAATDNERAAEQADLKRKVSSLLSAMAELGQLLEVGRAAVA